jgi:hypothetical protein
MTEGMGITLRKAVPLKAIPVRALQRNSSWCCRETIMASHHSLQIKQKCTNMLLSKTAIIMNSCFDAFLRVCLLC